jgi:flagellar biogenesis protein FliO
VKPKIYIFKHKLQLRLGDRTRIRIIEVRERDLLAQVAQTIQLERGERKKQITIEDQTQRTHAICFPMFGFEGPSPR